VRQVIEKYRLCSVYAADQQLARRIFIAATEHAICRMKIPQQYRQCRNPLDMLYLNGGYLTLMPRSFLRSWGGASSVWVTIVRGPIVEPDHYRQKVGLHTYDATID
jgi:hypothetical protein